MYSLLPRDLTVQNLYIYPYHSTHIFSTLSSFDKDTSLPVQRSRAVAINSTDPDQTAPAAA